MAADVRAGAEHDIAAGRECGPRWHRRRPSCAGSEDATRWLLLIGRKLLALRPLTFQTAGDRVLIGLSAAPMEGRPTRWWTVLSVQEGPVTALADFNRHRHAIRELPP